jgi:hypothetical protein
MSRLREYESLSEFTERLETAAAALKDRPREHWLEVEAAFRNGLEIGWRNTLAGQPGRDCRAGCSSPRRAQRWQRGGAGALVFNGRRPN